MVRRSVLVRAGVGVTAGTDGFLPFGSVGNYVQIHELTDAYWAARRQRELQAPRR